MILLSIFTSSFQWQKGTAKIDTKECRKLVEKLKRNLHRIITSGANARVEESDEIHERLYEIIIEMIRNKTF